MAVHTPFSIRHVAFRNRLLLAAVTRGLAAADGSATAEMRAHYARFAAAGVGGLITEASHVDNDRSATYFGQPGMVSGAHMDSWRPVVDAVRGTGARILLQLQHAGPFREPGLGPALGVDAGVPETVSWQRQERYFETRPASRGDLERITQAFATAAMLAERAGFDGIELHGARGYLLDAFLSGRHQREDEFGGSLKNRLRFPLQVVRAVRSAAPSLLVSYNLSLYKMDAREWRPPEGGAEVATIAHELAGAGVDLLHASTRGLDRCSVDGAPFVDLLRAAGAAPLMAGGGVASLTEADAALNAGRCDLVSMARALIANPDILERSRAGLPLRSYVRGMEREGAPA